MTEYVRVEMEKIQMISQQSKKNVPDRIEEYEQVAKATVPSTHGSTSLGSEAVVSRTGPNQGGSTADAPEALISRGLPFLQAKHVRKPVILKADDRTAKIRPIRFADFQETNPASIRSFIGGLSHCYNNLLMGIWGHATLIGMVLEKSDPFQTWLAELEDLIQNGSNLMQLLFGYIAERRSAARRLRFRQLLIELDAYRKIKGRGYEFDVIDNCICEISQATTRAKMAASLCRVIDRMQFLLQQKCHQIDEKTLGSEKAATHLEKIDALLERGVRLIINLQYYSGVRVPVKKSICLRSLLQRKADGIMQQNPKLRLKWQDPIEMPHIDADLYQVEHAVDLLLENAIEAIQEDGKIDLEINTLHSEAPKDRCGVHMLKDYAVITFKDTGKGMTTPFQSKIFEPFFTGIKGQGRAGLGLAAAAGIVRAHGGYLQVRSKSGKGSTFKIYLPLE